MARPPGKVEPEETAPATPPVVTGDGRRARKPTRTRTTKATTAGTKATGTTTSGTKATRARATRAGVTEARSASPDRKRRPRPAAPPRRERRLRHTVQKVDLWSVLKLSLCFYLCGLAVTIVALVALWLIADAFGIVSNIEDFIGDLLSSDDFTFLSGEMLRGVALVGLVVVMLQVVVTVIASAFYNLFAELFGGVEITVVEEEPFSQM
jgi:Transmembrane domain of unknown function (DUF3566)